MKTSYIEDWCLANLVNSTDKDKLSQQLRKEKPIYVIRVMTVLFAFWICEMANSKSFSIQEVLKFAADNPVFIYRAFVTSFFFLYCFIRAQTSPPKVQTTTYLMANQPTATNMPPPITTLVQDPMTTSQSLPDIVVDEVQASTSSSQPTTTTISCPFNREVHIEAISDYPPELVIQTRSLVVQDEPSLSTDDWDWVLNDQAVGRYLVARKLDVQGARKQMVASLKWRQLRRPDDIQPWDVKVEIETGKTSVRGLDQFNRPVIVLDSAKENTFDMTGNMKGLVFTLNRAIRLMKPPVQKYVVIVRLGETSMFNFSKLPGPSQVKETIKVLMTVFAERMGHAILYQPPKIFTAFLNLFSSLMDAHIFEKVIWIRGDVSEGSVNDLKMKEIVGSNWRQLVGEGQPVFHPTWSPGYDSPVEWNKLLAEWTEQHQ